MRARRASPLQRVAPAAVGGRDHVRRVRPPRPLLVALDRRRVVEQRLHNAPRLLDDGPAREERLVAAQCIREQPLVRLRRLAELFGEVEIERDRLRDCLARRLGTEKDRDTRMAPDAKDDVVMSRRVEAMATPLQLWNALEADD